MDRLSAAILDRLPPEIARPRYDRASVTSGVVHLGVGAFHRAHQAVYFDDLLGRGANDWGVIGASLRRPDLRDALRPQDWLYALRSLDGDGVATRLIGALTNVMVGPENPSALLAAMADPAIRLVTLTITEKGYLHDPATGALNPDHPDVIADHITPEAPRSAIGYLVEALARRREAGQPPFTVMSCDNLPANGVTTRSVVLAFAQRRDPGLADWIEAKVAFPSSMVDRIAPATTEADRAAASDEMGVVDAWPISTEPFSQWVVQDWFSAGRPALETVGVEMVADVAPYERMKLRLLNGSHSTLAYLGYLAGHETVADAMADPEIAALVAGLMRDEAAPTLDLPVGVDVAAYRARLLARFQNPALKHRTWQIAMDGSQKLPQRLLATASERLAAGAPIERLALGIAGWMRYVMGRDEIGAPIDVRDPMADRLAAIAESAGGDADRLAEGYLGVEEVFPRPLAEDPRFAKPVAEALRALLSDGAAQTVSALNARLGATL